MSTKEETANGDAGFAKGATSTVSPEDLSPSPKQKKHISFYMSVLTLGLMALITSWDATSLAIALPTISEELGGTTLLSFWANVSFMLGVTITQPVYMTASDVFGRKPALYTSMMLFFSGIMVFATANTMTTIVAGRIIQGLGAGGLDVLEDIILADITSLKERPLYLGIISIAIALGTITGPIFGSLFSEFVSWRWIGWINLPVLGVSFLLAFFYLKLKPVPMGLLEKFCRLDWIGISLFSAGSIAFSLPLSWASALYPWSSWRTILPLAIGLALFVAFAFYEKRINDTGEPMIPYRIFNRTATLSIITGFIHGLILYTILLYLPLYLQAVFLQSPLEAAKSILPIAVFVVVFSFVGPVTVESTRRYRITIWVGWILTTVFLGLWCLVDHGTPKAQVYVFQSLLGAGLGILFTVTQLPLQASVADVNDMGVAIGTFVTFRLFGALIGLAVGSTAFSSVFETHVRVLETLPDEAAVLRDPSQAISFIPALVRSHLPDDTMDILINAYRQSFQAIWIVMTVLSGLGLIASFFMKELTLEKEDVGRQGLEHPE
ncbi:MFS general substrate transporter [Xylariomycetidae sp. FL2044]|nr:MFS general substrate transporter [Xylariomycetidae sp. FL2044]